MEGVKIRFGGEYTGFVRLKKKNSFKDKPKIHRKIKNIPTEGVGFIRLLRKKPRPGGAAFLQTGY
jgi:hypothetical protein